MPKVRITAGTGTRGADLSVGLEPLQSVAEDLKARRGLEYTTKMAEYAAEGARIKLIEEQYNQDYKTALDQIMEAEKAKGGSFDANTAKTLREMAKEVANANAASSLGEKYDYTLSKEEAYETIAKNNRALDAMANNAGPLAALRDKFEKSSKLADDEIGKIKYDGSGNVADLYDVITGVANNSPLVTYEVDERGNSYYKKNINGREVKIPIEAINSIMTGENADYPFTVNADPTQSLKAVHESIPAGTYSTEDIQSDEYKEDGKIVTDKGKQILISKSKYRNEVMAKLDGILKDPKQMASFWGTIGGQGVYDPNASSNSGNGPDVARKLLTDWAEKNLLPTGDYTTQQSNIKKLPTPTGSKKVDPPDPLDPKVQKQINTNRQIARSLYGGDNKKSYRYGGKVTNGNMVAGHLNNSLTRPNDVTYVGINQAINDPDKYGLDDNAVNRLEKMLKDNEQNKKNVYVYNSTDGTFTPYITAEDNLARIESQIDKAYGFDDTSRYSAPRFKTRNLAGPGKAEYNAMDDAAKKVYDDSVKVVEDLLAIPGASPRDPRIQKEMKKIPMPKSGTAEYQEIQKKAKAMKLNPNNAADLQKAALQMRIDYYEYTLAIK
jgi:hypothetical protein